MVVVQLLMVHVQKLEIALMLMKEDAKMEVASQKNKFALLKWDVLKILHTDVLMGNVLIQKKIVVQFQYVIVQFL